MISPLLLSAVIATAARGQEGRDGAGVRAGSQVVLRSPVTALRIGDRADGGSVAYRRYRVEKVEGDRVRIAAGGLRGWVETGEVVPCDFAEDDGTRLIRDHPDAAWAYNRRGLARYERREFDGAIADFDRAIRLDPGRPAYRDNRAAALTARGAPDLAVAGYDAALRVDPNDAAAHLGRGVVHLQRDDPGGAIADFDAAIRLRPRFAAAYNDRGLARLAVGEFDGAIADFNEAIRLDPFDPAPRNNRGLAREAKGDRRGALDAFDATIVLGTSHARTYVNRGRLLAEGGDVPAALADFDTAIRLDPRDFWPYAARARVWATAPDPSHRDGPRAVESATLACELSGWRHAEALTALAASCAEVGDFDAAEAWQSKALDALPDGPRKDAARALLALYQAHKPDHGPAPGPATDRRPSGR